MDNESKKEQAAADKDGGQTDKKKIKHDPQAESARVKFGKKK